MTVSQIITTQLVAITLLLLLLIIEHGKLLACMQELAEVKLQRASDKVFYKSRLKQYGCAIADLTEQLRKEKEAKE